jgi:predicted TPR repeat methyltransferase
MTAPDEARVRRSHGYESPRPDVQELVPLGARNILELGCSTGALGKAIKERQPARFVGVELLEEYASIAADRLDRVVVADAGSFLSGPPPAEAPFDCLIAADVLEHLVDPWDTLRRAAGLLSPGATAVVSLPNVLYWKTLLQALRERRWPREDQGIFDRTHLRWFAPADARELLEQAGFAEIRATPIFWMGGWRLALAKAVAPGGLRDFLPAQTIVTGVLPGTPAASGLS